MLQDPEKPFEEWEADVWASSLDAAWSKCELIAAEDPMINLLNVTQARKMPTKQGNYRFVCWFRTEVSENDNSNN